MLQDSDMRYLSAISTPTVAAQIERCMGAGRLQPVRPDEDFGGEKFAAIIADHSAQLPTLRRGLPVILVAPMHREGMRHFRIIAEDGIDVRMWSDCGGTLSETTLKCLSAPRAPTPAAPIIAHLRGRYGGLAADVLTAAAVMSNGRRSMDEIARACDASPSAVRNGLREEGLISISGILARMRCLHAVWSLEGGRQNFWSMAGFRTLAELSAHLSQHSGAPLGRWKVAGGFSALLQTVTDAMRDRDEMEAAG
jgi:AraC-like DNA-binding protein